MPSMFLAGARRWTGRLLAAASLVALSACGTVQTLSADVSSYGNWPPSLTAATFVFERLPSQEAHPEVQGQLEEAARPALIRAGLQPAAQGRDPQVLVQVAAAATTFQNTFSDPWGRRWDPRWGPYWDPRFDPRIDPRFRGSTWAGRGFYGAQFTVEPPVTRMQVRVLIRERQSGRVIHETGATVERNGGFQSSLLEPMFFAALSDFPGPAISPRTVRVPLVAGDDFPIVPPVPVPASAPTPAPAPAR